MLAAIRAATWWLAAPAARFEPTPLLAPVADTCAVASLGGEVEVFASFRSARAFARAARALHFPCTATSQDVINAWLDAAATLPCRDIAEEVSID